MKDKIVACLVLAALAVVSVPAQEEAEPERVTVQHILISFKTRIPGRYIDRSKKAAEALAREVFALAQSGEDFDALVKEYTDDSHPGIYGMANRGIVPHGENEYRREDMVPGFGDVAFGLDPDGVGLCEFDAMKSPFGFHIIKRLQ